MSRDIGNANSLRAGFGTYRVLQHVSGFDEDVGFLRGWFDALRVALRGLVQERRRVGSGGAGRGRRGLRLRFYVTLARNCGVRLGWDEGLGGRVGLRWSVDLWGSVGLGRGVGLRRGVGLGLRIGAGRRVGLGQSEGL